MTLFDRFQTTVSAADISRNFGEWQSRAMLAPVAITHHGRPRLVLSSIDAFEVQHRRAGQSDSRPENRSHDIRLRAVLSRMREGFLALDADLHVLDANHAAELFLGLSRDMLIGRDLRDVSPATKPSVSWDLYRRVIRSGQPVEFSVASTVHPQLKIRVRGFPYSDGGIGVIFTNLLAEDEARICQGRLNAITKALSLEPLFAIIRVNLRGGLEAVDANFCRMTGFAEQQLVSLLLTDILHEPDRRNFLRALNTVVRDSVSASSIVTVLAHDGSDRRLQLNMSLVEDDAVSTDVMVAVIDYGAWQGEHH